MTAHYVYRCFDLDERLLYVGCTRDLSARLSQHAASSFWANSVVKVRGEVHPTKLAGRRAERLAIHMERPAYNILGREPQRMTFTDSEWADHLRALEAASDKSGSRRALRTAIGQHEALSRLRAAGYLA